LIRRLGPDEWELLREVRLRSLSDAPDAFASTFEREAGFDPAVWRERVAAAAWFVGDDGDATIGIVSGRRDPAYPELQRHLNAMWVAASARGTGVATGLVDAVVAWAAADGATELTLGVLRSNQRAVAFYLKCGFAALGEHFFLNDDPTRPVDIYRRDLTV